MTQADKANEGREEKTKLYGTYDQVLQSLHEAHDDLDQHKQIIRKRNNEITELRDQLSKEREKVKRMDEELTTEFERGYNIAKNEEREMRKELVDGLRLALRKLLASCARTKTNPDDVPDIKTFKDLIEKATELDKK